MTQLPADDIAVDPEARQSVADPKPVPEVHTTRGNAPELSLHAVAPVEISIDEVTIHLRTKSTSSTKFRAASKKPSEIPAPSPKPIISGVSANFSSGSLTAIIGSSGSGKTSLLNCLSGRLSRKGLETTGTVLYNGAPQLSSIRSAYVLQQDILLPTLTVREILQYSAELRLPPPVSDDERAAVVEQVLLELGLKDCADTRIGNHSHKGCSGGEKRRTSLGVQLLANPSVLFLDEVTTGLDAASALQLIKTLKQLAETGRTIIVTLHQPRSEIWGLFDNILLLAEGYPLYCGLREACIPYFEGLGYLLPAFVNPAEHIIDLAAIDARSSDLEKVSRKRVEQLQNSWRDSPAYTNEKPSPSLTTDGHQPVFGCASFSRQLRVQTTRTLKTTWRDPMGITGSFSEALLMGIITGWVFLDLDGSLTGIRSRIGALYTAAAQQGFLIMIFEIYRLTLDIAVFDKEHTEGVVGVPSFLISRRLARLFVEDIPVPLIFSLIFYFMSGFRHLASQFFTFFALILLSHYLAVTLAMLCVSLSRNFAGASMVANLSFTIQTLCSGFFVQSNQIPVYVRWLKYVSYVWYANGALCANEFISHTSDPAGQLYACPFSGGTSNPECNPYTGIFIMNSLGFPSNWNWRPFIIMVSFILAFYTSAAFILTYKRVEMVIGKAQKSQVNVAEVKEEISDRPSENVVPLEITLDKCSIEISKRIKLRTKKVTKSVLDPITTKFEPGVLNVILGPSGSGKTTLLNLISDRLHNHAGTTYHSQGKVLYNGAIPSKSVMRSLTSYVCQDDDALLSTLTVRETLHFAACLRLPSWMSRGDKMQRAEFVLLKLGLKHCADNIVGDDLKKGISGGEKRRVSIATQILTNPQILLLDEPTSGLDAFTATSIIEVLSDLAAEGRTVVFTIHQPGSNLFQRFDNVLLLARGGSPTYSGKGSDMLSYFSSIGFDCPVNTNPSDFALDLVAVDTRRSEIEATSRDKVQKVIEEWKQREKADSSLSPGDTQISMPAELGRHVRKVTPFRVAFPLLVKRSLINFRRDPTVATARISQVLGYAVMITLFFAPLKSNYEGIQSRFGFIQELVAIYFVGMLQNVAVYPSEKKAS
ncbi:ABC transporter [Phlyctema vagabunda]|uniref:ABC transporter n=1 Tax=Phlyctema vagabunda TaxID=108571 RepID=A0ABR4PCM1_9HELO